MASERGTQVGHPPANPHCGSPPNPITTTFIDWSGLCDHHEHLQRCLRSHSLGVARVPLRSCRLAGAITGRLVHRHNKLGQSRCWRELPEIAWPTTNKASTTSRNSRSRNCMESTAGPLACFPASQFALSRLYRATDLLFHCLDPRSR